MRLHYESWGDRAGQPVILLHGLTGCAVIWTDVASALARRGYLVIAPDLRGHGGSDWSGDYSLNTHVSDVVALIALLALGPANVVGHSFGGSVAWELAATRTELVRRLVIEDQHPQPDPAGLVYWQEWAETWPRCFSSRDDGVTWLRAHERSLSWWEPSLTMLPGGDWGWAFDIPGSVQAAAALRHGDGWDTLARVKAPTLLIRGEQSTHLTPAVAQRMATTIPHCKLVSIPGEDHWVHRHPEPYASIVGTFFEQRDAPTA